MHARRTRLDALVAIALISAGCLFHSYLPTSDPAPARHSRAQSQTGLIETGNSYGSGVFVKRVNSAGATRVFVWTAAHVVHADPRVVQVKLIFRLPSGDMAGVGIFDAIPLGVDSATDLALYWVNVPAQLVSAVEFAPATAEPIGTPIFHVGNFLGPNFDGSVSSGRLSQHGVAPKLQGWWWKSLDQADLTVLPGGSGGGVFRVSDGRVIGIMVAGPSNGVACFVPNRTIYAWAKQNGLGWAVQGSFCPADDVLAGLFREVPSE